jgi:hypothetical protein
MSVKGWIFDSGSNRASAQMISLTWLVCGQVEQCGAPLNAASA